MRGSSVVGFVAFTAVLANAMVASASSIEDTASKLADKIAAQLADVEGKPDVAVFPFSNSRGNMTAEMGNLPTLLQGEIIHALTERSEDRFHVMNKATLARRLKGRQVSTREIDPSDRDGTASVLDKAGIGFAVLGSMDGVIGRELKSWDEIKISAAVFDDQGDVSQVIDGVNSFFEPDAQGDYMPTARAPEHCSRWILTPPGRILKAEGGEERWGNNDLRINDGTLESIGGTGHSTRTVSGFQATDETAMAFVFGDSGDSLAEQIGIDKEIGLISIYVYPEIVPEEKPDLKIMDPNMVAAVGTMTGRPLPSDVQGFQVNLVEEPRQIWRIYYRHEGEPLPVPKADLVRFAP